MILFNPQCIPDLRGVEMIKTSLFAAQERQAKLDEKSATLRKIAEIVDFAAIARRVDEKLPRSPVENGGRPRWPTETMVRLLILQNLYNLSDDHMENQMLDRRSFQDFLGLTNSGRIPDAKTIWLFRERLVKAGLGEVLFAEVLRQVNARGFRAEQGQMIDATLIPVPIQRNSKEENEAIKNGKTPKEWGVNKRRQKDPDARWTKKNGKSHYGYKASVSGDIKHKIIRTLHTPPASD